jgi:hypothetical protein
MNYIKQLSTVIEKFSEDDRLNTAHVSLYLALFQLWNLNRFKNPISINRAEVMKISKIGSKGTYHRCLNDLNNWSYLKYEPSHNPLKGSIVYMFNFETSIEQASVQVQGQLEVQVAGQVSEPSINYTKLSKQKKTISNTNSKELVNTQNENEENFVFKKEADAKHQDFQNPKVKNAIPKNLEEVETYFLEKEKPKSEANKFFNHYEANGWLVGKNKMKNWRAAANNWMANIGKYNNSHQKEKTNYLHVDQDKDYSIPL